MISLGRLAMASALSVWDYVLRIGSAIVLLGPIVFLVGLISYQVCYSHSVLGVIPSSREPLPLLGCHVFKAVFGDGLCFASICSVHP